ncbi:glycoside hydrolase family 26 protein [Streptomyces sp. NPDC020800]|uniref:glycoside hydrolase family 26 protein n=1 Tax=Streptomyces sp. NPDC020800 TaxID=3365092 RepID=UPI00379000F4
MTSERRRSTLRRLAFITAGVLASAALVPGPDIEADATANPGAPRCVPAARSATPGAPAAPRPAGPTPSACPAGGAPASPKEATRVPAFGAFLHYGPLGVARMQGLSDWLDGSEVRVGRTYLPGDLWGNIEGAPGFLDSWAEWRRAKDDRLLVLNVPMMERNEAHLSDPEVRGLLRRAAAGEFDQHFRALAQHLVDLGATDTILVLGWEMNGITYSHRCGPEPEDWKRYWRRIVTVMRSVPGQQFRFDFAPNRGADAVPWPLCYPGDDVVDIIGMDSYDQPQGITFDRQVSERYGLQFQVDFAKAHGKPTSYPEWGLYRNGDNVSYMLRMLAWMDEHPPLYNSITDYCPHGVWLCTANPRASALYRAALAGRRAPGTDPAQVPVSPVPASPPAPQPTPNPNPTPNPTAHPTPPATPAQSPHCPCTPSGLPR